MAESSGKRSIIVNDRKEIQKFENNLLEKISPQQEINSNIACRSAEGVHQIVFTGDGKRLAAAMGRSIQIWDCQMGKCIQVLNGHTSSIRSLVMTSDGEHLLSSSWQEIIRWNRKSSQPVEVIKTDGQSPLFLLSDGTTYLNAVYSSIYFSDLNTGKRLRSLYCWNYKNIIDSLAVSADGRRVAAGFFEGRDIAYFDSDIGEKMTRLAGHGAQVETLAMTPDGRLLVSGDKNGGLRLWNLDSRSCMSMLAGHYGGIRSVAVTPDGKTVISGSEDRTVRVWDVKMREQRQVLMGNLTTIQALAISPDGRTFASGGADSSIILWDLDTGLPQQTLIGLTRSVSCLNHSSDELLVACTDHDEKLVRLRKFTPDGTCSTSQIRLIEHRKNAATAVSPNHSLIAIGGRKTICLYDAASGRLIRKLFGHTDFAPGLKFSPDGRWLFSASASLDKTWRIWDVRTGECLKAIKVNRDIQIGLYSFGFLPDGKTFLLGGVRTVSMWDMETGQVIQKVLENHEPHMIMALAVHPNGKTFVTGAWDDKIREWDLLTGDCLRIFEGHHRIVSSLTFSRDGSLLISGSEGGVVNYWDYDTSSLLATAYMVDEGYLWTTPPDDFAKHGWLHTNRFDLISLIAVDPNNDDLEYIKEYDERFKDYLKIYNDGEMVMTRINNWSRYQELLNLRIGNKEQEEYAQIEARILAEQRFFLDSGRPSNTG
jgi:WD40 repeat protein